MNWLEVTQVTCVVHFALYFQGVAVYPWIQQNWTFTALLYSSTNKDTTISKCYLSIHCPETRVRHILAWPSPSINLPSSPVIWCFRHKRAYFSQKTRASPTSALMEAERVTCGKVTCATTNHKSRIIFTRFKPMKGGLHVRNLPVRFLARPSLCSTFGELNLFKGF